MIADRVGGVRAQLGESPVWDPRRQVVWWVDILAGRLHCHDPAGGVETAFEFGTSLGCIGLRQGGGLVAATGRGFEAFDPETGDLEWLAGPGPERDGGRFNDGTISPDGRFLAATMRLEPPFDAAAERLLVLDGNRKADPIVEDLCIANGLAFSPDGGTLYLSDSHPARSLVWAFDWHSDDGSVSNRRVFHDHRSLDGYPDGAAVDADGCYWFAASHGWSLVRLDPAGRVDRVIGVPVQKPTKPVFGGSRLDTLYFTSIGINLEPGSEQRQPDAGGLFAVMPGITGLPSSLFAG